MFGWCRWAIVIASCLNRSTMPSPSISPGDITLIATLRSSGISCARNTAAMPPWPSSRPISNSPRVARRSRSTMSAIGDEGSGGLGALSSEWEGAAGAPQCGHERIADIGSAVGVAPLHLDNFAGETTSAQRDKHHMARALEIHLIPWVQNEALSTVSDL